MDKYIVLLSKNKYVLARTLQHQTCNEKIFIEKAGMITGIDLSEKNGAIDWNLFVNANVQFVYLKASEGLNSVDTAYESSLKKAREYGIPAGAYHRLAPHLHIGKQAQVFFSAIKNIRGLLPPAIVLTASNVSPKETERNVKRFLEVVRDGLGVTPILYTSEEYWKTNLPSAEWGCQYHLWVDKPGNYWPKQIWPWAGWTFWQYAYQSYLPGIPTCAGMNMFNGTQADLRELVIQ